MWNPWVEKAREIQDFGDDEYPNMICVEAGHVSAPVILLPGTAFEASEILQVMWNGHHEINPENSHIISSTALENFPSAHKYCPKSNF